MTILIAVAGGFGSGKSEVVNIIKNIHGANKVTNVKFAQPLYELQELIQNHLGLPNKKDRNLLQLLGTEWGRKNDPDIWVDLYIKNLEKIKLFYEVIICDDLRYLNEFKALKGRGFSLVKISRPMSDRLPYLYKGSRKHSSENELLTVPNSDYDYFIENNSTYDDFVYVVSEMFLDIKENTL
jgi:hypothetical protein